jgi:hypothetical protein
VKTTPFSESLVERDHRVERVGGKEGVNAVTIKDKLGPLELGVAFSGIPEHLQMPSQTVHGDQPQRRRRNPARILLQRNLAILSDQLPFVLEFRVLR